MWGEGQYLMHLEASSLHILLIARSSSLASRSSFASATVLIGGCSSASAASFLALRISLSPSKTVRWDHTHLSCLKPALAACFIRSSCLRSLRLLPCLYFPGQTQTLAERSRHLESSSVRRSTTRLSVVVVIDGIVVWGCGWTVQRLFSLVLFGTHVRVEEVKSWNRGIVNDFARLLAVAKRLHSTSRPGSTTHAHLLHKLLSLMVATPTVLPRPPLFPTLMPRPQQPYPDTPRDTWASGRPAHHAT
jgi:hypothetical protein